MASVRGNEWSLGRRPNFTPRAVASFRPSLVRAGINLRPNSARPPRIVTISWPCGVVVSTHASANDRKPAPWSEICAQYVEPLPRRSRQVVEACHHQHVAFVEQVEGAAELPAIDARSWHVLAVNVNGTSRAQRLHLGVSALAVC